MLLLVSPLRQCFSEQIYCSLCIVSYFLLLHQHGRVFCPFNIDDIEGGRNREWRKEGGRKGEERFTGSERGEKERETKITDLQTDR